MTFVNKSLNAMLEEIEFTQFGEYDIIVPVDGVEVNLDIGMVITFPYRKKIVEQVLECVPKSVEEEAKEIRKNPVTEYLGEENIKSSAAGRLLMGMTYAVENAYTRGNNFPANEVRTNNGYLPFSVKAFKGRNGIVFRVRDSGPGFDFINEIKRAPSRTDRMHGMLMMGYCSSEVSYEGKGSIVNIMIKELGEDNES